MTPAEQQAAAAKAASEAAERAEAARRLAEEQLRRHGQAMSGIGGRS
ncbi:hypothetical protein ACF09E_34715 [Streptomyces sp. NPDC014891]